MIQVLPYTDSNKYHCRDFYVPSYVHICDLISSLQQTGKVNQTLFPPFVQCLPSKQVDTQFSFVKSNWNKVWKTIDMFHLPTSFQKNEVDLVLTNFLKISTLFFDNIFWHLKKYKKYIFKAQGSSIFKEGKKCWICSRRLVLQNYSVMGNLRGLSSL